MLLVLMGSIVPAPLYGLEDSTTSCPPWMVLQDAECTCPDLSRFNSELLFCDSKTHTVYVALGTCITYWNDSSDQSLLVVGECPYYPPERESYRYGYYRNLPGNESELNDVMCGPFNRQGLLCSSCRPGYGISVYSVGLSCVKCDENHIGALWYVLLELIPITALFALVVLFSVRATSAPMAGLIFIFQTLIFVVRARVGFYASLVYSTGMFGYVLLKILLSLCGIWNLDFFRFVIPPFCVDENIKNIHVVFLEYISALYPLFLVLVTYIVIELHAHNTRPVVWLWKPFHKCYVGLRKTWNVRHSIVNAFSTFLLLSYSKFLFVSFRLLSHSSITDLNGTVILNSFRYDPTVRNFGTTHTPFAVMAIFFIIVFTILPMLLLVLYPTKLFQHCLGGCRCRAVHVVHLFVDTFQGCLKDGTSGTRDYRVISAVYLVLRFALVAHYVQHSHTGLTLIIFGLIYMLISLLLAVFKPYKSDFMNFSESALLFLLGVEASTLYIWHFNSGICQSCAAIVLIFIGLLPHFALMGYMLYVLLRGRVITRWVKSRTAIHVLKCFYKPIKIITRSYSMETQHEIITFEESLPDRINNPDRDNDLMGFSSSYSRVNNSESGL